MRIRNIAAAVVVVAAMAATVLAPSAALAVTPEEARALRAARIVTALEAQPGLVAAAQAAAAEQPREKAVSKTDKNSFTVIGNVFFYDSDFLSDGTPITVGVADVKKPFAQEIYFSCLGSLASTCRALGRRQLEGFLLAGDGESTDEYLHFLIVTKVKK